MKTKIIVVSVLLFLFVIFTGGCLQFMEELGGITSPSLEVDRSGDGVVDYWAVIVGIEDYQFITDLSYTIDDAVDMKDVLVSYSNWNDSNSNIQLLTDVDASKENIELFVNTMVTSADEDDVCLFFFSGHGSRIPDEEDGDEADTFDEVICPYNTTKELGYVISDDELGTWLSVYSGNVVVILDTCMSGGFTNSIEETVKSVPNPQVPKDAIAKKHFGEGLVERLKQRPISRDLNQTGYVVLMACEEDKSAYESRRLENGVFTYYIVEGLWGPADADNDNSVSAEEDFYYADPLVRQYKPTNQAPQLYDGYGGDTEEELLLVIASTSVTGYMHVDSIDMSLKTSGPLVNAIATGMLVTAIYSF
ncbi:MAG: caspase family protein [Nanoarchaeota archaeon]|nr:caspase family protein [Nanoarchaeota archaeon]